MEMANPVALLLDPHQHGGRVAALSNCESDLAARWYVMERYLGVNLINTHLSRCKACPEGPNVYSAECNCGLTNSDGQWIGR
jgi:hypothetical protein